MKKRKIEKRGNRELIIAVKPASRRVGVKMLSDGTYAVMLKARPIEGEANKELIELMAAHLAVPKSALVIKSGLKSRLKKIVVSPV